MRWLATADVHLSNALPYCRVDWESGISDRLNDFDRLAKFICDTAKKQATTGLLILGDLFDRNLLDAITLKYASSWVQYLSDAFDHVLILPGNHENYDARSMHFTSEWLRSLRNVDVVASPMVKGKLAFVPYMPLGRLRREVAKLRGKAPVLCLHTTFAGSTEHGHTFQSGVRARDVRGFDLVLTGHIHKSQKLPHGIPGRYLGSPLPIDFRDNTQKRLWVIDDDRVVRSVKVPPEVAIPFQTVHVDAERDKASAVWDGDLAGSGYLKLKVRGTREAVGKFVAQAREQYDVSSYRYVGYEHSYTNEKVKDRAVELGPEAGTDLRRSIQVWLKYTERDRDTKWRKRIALLGQELLDETKGDTVVARKRAILNPLELTLRNFGLIRKADELPLENAGIVLIAGRNADTTGADSNGAGKTTVFSAVTWLFFGRTIYGETGDDVVRKGSSRATVRLTVQVDGERIVLERRKPLREPAMLAIKRRGRWLRGTTTELQSQFQEVLGLSFEAYRNAVLFGQDDVKRFADPKTLDGTRKAIFRDIIGLGPLEDARKFANERLKEDTRALEANEREQIRLRTTIEQSSVAMLRKQSADHVSNLRKDLKTAKDELAAAQRLRADKSLPTFAELASARKARDKATVRVQNARKRYERARVQYDRTLRTAHNRAGAVRAEIERASADVDHYKEQLSKLQGKVCPVCSSSLTSMNVKGYRSTLRLELKKAEQRLRVAEKKRDAAVALDTPEAQREVDELAERLEARKEAEQKLQAKCDKLEKHGTAMARLDANEEVLGGTILSIRKKLKANPYAKLLREAKAKRAKAKTELAQCTADHTKLSEHCEDLRFWIGGFGATGLQTWIMDTLVPGLNERVNEHLALLSDGSMRMFIDTEAKTKRGASRDKFSLTTYINDQPAPRNSGGEQRKVEIAVGLGLMDLVTKREGVNINLLMLDEVFDGLDATGKDRVMLLLGSLRSKRGTALVVSHDPELKGGSAFDGVWRVTRRKGSSTVRVVR